MLAIPSPDVLLNLFASAGQLLGLLALALGGGAFVKQRNSIGGKPVRATSRWPFLVSVGLLLSVSCGFLLYFLHVQDVNNQRLRTNLVRKSMEADKAVGDTSLKTLSFSGQSKHPQGVTTDTLAQWLDEGKPLNIIDVREPEEVEMGQIAGAWARRYPDLQVDHAGLVVDGKATLLVCESGNRSSELVDWFGKRGIATHFVVGGYEKWVAEYRPMTGQRADGSEIRATPDFPQKQILLDTPEVVALFTEQQALFVDVRYPEDFARGHLPGAVNIPLRKMLAAEADAALRELPARPIVTVCYDKRSSFYGLLAGLRLHRMGKDFRGRYTVPHEFALPAAEGAWVAAWKADREGDTLFGKVGTSVGALVAWLAERFGLLAAIVLLVVLLRTAMLPFSLFAERDQWAQRRFAPRLQELKAQWAHDPMVWRREAMRALKAAGVSPLRNLVGALVQIALFAAAFAGVNEIAGKAPLAVLWFDLSLADASGVLPLLFGLVMAGFVRQQQQNKRRWVLPAVFVIGMTALVWQSRAAVLLYLIASLGLMAAQTWLQRRWLARGHRQGMPVALPAPVALVPLERAGDHPELGNKAVRLGRMLTAGLPVPAGFVVPTGIPLTDPALARAAARARIETAAVRSSAVGEDSATASMAGMFRTELDVPVPALAVAVGRVIASYRGRSGGVVVQSFRRAQYSGVLFTVDPAHAGRLLVELVAGGCDELVSGRATPKSFRFGRVTRELVGEQAPPLPLDDLLALAARVEALFGRPQDIEWVHADGRFQLVQARDITVQPGQDKKAAAIEAERGRLLAAFAASPADEVVLEQTEISELLPAPTTYSLALFQSLWEAGGTVDRACRSLGVPYDVGVDAPPLVQTAFGRCYVATAQRRARSRRALSGLTSFRLATTAQGLEAGFVAAQTERTQRIVRLSAIDPALLPDAELLALCDEVRAHFVEDTYAEAEAINVVAAFFVDAARRQAQKAGLDFAALLRDPAGNVVSRAFAHLAGPGSDDSRIDAFLRDFGHRARHDFELAEERYREERSRLHGMLARGEARPAAAEVAAVVPGSRLLVTAVQRAKRCQALKEECKHAAMRELALLRSLLVHVGARFGLGDRVFDLSPAEVARLLEPETRAKALATARQRASLRTALLAVEVPAKLTRASLERLGEVEVVLPAAAGLTGTCVAGSREVVGRVRVLESADQLGDLQPGEILVTRCTDPCWLPAFASARGLITEIGGWLSHAAIQAREHDLATIVGVERATRRLRTGDVVCLRRDGIVVLVPERRRPRQPVDVAGELRLGARSQAIRVRDLGVDGALIEVGNPAELPDTPFELHFGGEAHAASVVWRNCTRAGVKFDSVLPAPGTAVSNGESPALVRLSRHGGARR
ncbi:MAG: PEP/pyruvate-binding domain-containing protein [Planctomycetota bacterium]